MKAKILLLSKNDSSTARLSQALSRADYEVRSFADEKQGLHFFHGTPIDAVILDLVNDWRTARRLKEMNQFIPVICVSNEEQIDSAHDWADASITRPVELGNLLGLLDRFVKETVEERLERVCGDDQACRFVASFYTPFLNRLEQAWELNEA